MNSFRAATNAMVNALFFAEKNFEQEEERKVIVNTLLQRAQDSDETVRYQAYNCLKLMAKEYYQTIGAHMADIFNVTTSTVGHDTSIRVAASAIDFWIHIAEVRTSEASMLLCHTCSVIDWFAGRR